MIQLFAADPTPTGSPQDPCKQLGGCVQGIEAFSKGDTGNNIYNFIIAVSNFLTFVAGAVAILFIIIGAYRMVTSNGDDAQYKKGVQTLIWAVAGLILAILAYSIVYLIGAIIPNINLTAGSTPSTN